MKRGYLVEMAHQALSDPNKAQCTDLLNSVNLTLLEREIISQSEIDGVDIETICNSLKSWNKNTVCSYANCYRIKRTGMIKIGTVLSGQKV